MLLVCSLSRQQVFFLLLTQLVHFSSVTANRKLLASFSCNDHGGSNIGDPYYFQKINNPQGAYLRWELKSPHSGGAIPKESEIAILICQRLLLSDLLTLSFTLCILQKHVLRVQLIINAQPLIIASPGAAVAVSTQTSPGKLSKEIGS